MRRDRLLTAAAALGLTALLVQSGAYGAPAVPRVAFVAGSVISVLPVLLVFLLGQRQFIQGIATSGLKG